MPHFQKRHWLYIFGTVYVIIDLFLFNGPISKIFETFQNEELVSPAELAAREGIVATVNAHPIYKLELERRIDQYCMKNGINQSKVSKKRIEEIGDLCLNNLVVDKLIWFHSYHTPAQLNDEQVNDALIKFRKGFENSKEYEIAAESQGFSISKLDTFIENQFMQRVWIERVIAKYIDVTEEEIYARYEKDKSTFLNPERFNVQQIFFATLDKDPNVLKKQIDEVYDLIIDGEDFDQLVQKYSEDPRSKQSLGYLDWLTKKRIPRAFYDKLYQLNVGQISEPFETKIGWHIIRLLERKQQSILPLMMIRDEIAATIEVEKREAAIKALINYIRRKAKIRYIENWK
tara:strand:- start:822 stop:1856 length:1035 start_codon:yes stop_codon:yes gene_type:complete